MGTYGRLNRTGAEETDVRLSRQSLGLGEGVGGSLCEERAQHTMGRIGINGKGMDLWKRTKCQEN